MFYRDFQVRMLKGDKAPKEEITAAVQVLLSLKTDYKQITGQDWDPNSKPQQKGGVSDPIAAWEKVQTQGDKVREFWKIFSGRKTV